MVNGFLLTKSIGFSDMLDAAFGVKIPKAVRMTNLKDLEIEHLLFDKGKVRYSHVTFGGKTF